MRSSRNRTILGVMASGLFVALLCVASRSSSSLEDARRAFVERAVEHSPTFSALLRQHNIRIAYFIDGETPEFVAVAVGESHETHFVRLATLRVHRDGSVADVTYD